jgi:nucleoid DNA-binding protein
MDKPVSLAMKDWLIRKLAPKLMISEKTLEAVINHQFQSASEAMLSNKTVEISGFGKLIFNDKKAIKKMHTYRQIEKALLNILDKPDLSEAKRASTQLKLQSTRHNIEVLKPKLHENQLLPDIRGVEEQPHTA